MPELLPYLKMLIDENRQRYGHWLLTGSQQFALMKNVSESLAGRIALLELLPFSLLEYAPATETLEERLWRSDYPEPALAPDQRELWLRSYLQTYVEHDVRLLHNIQDLRGFELFLGLCASRHGQVFNKAALARECGVSEPTIKTWGQVLAASYAAAGSSGPALAAVSRLVARAIDGGFYVMVGFGKESHEFLAIRSTVVSTGAASPPPGPNRCGSYP